jgi:hypothetical protein
MVGSLSEHGPSSATLTGRGAYGNSYSVLNLKWMYENEQHMHAAVSNYRLHASQPRRSQKKVWMNEYSIVEGSEIKISILRPGRFNARSLETVASNTKGISRESDVCHENILTEVP